MSFNSTLESYWIRLTLFFFLFYNTLLTWHWLLICSYVFQFYFPKIYYSFYVFFLFYNTFLTWHWLLKYMLCLSIHLFSYIGFVLCFFFSHLQHFADMALITYMLWHKILYVILFLMVYLLAGKPIKVLLKDYKCFENKTMSLLFFFKPMKYSFYLGHPMIKSYSNRRYLKTKMVWYHFRNCVAETNENLLLII